MNLLRSYVFSVVAALFVAAVASATSYGADQKAAQTLIIGGGSSHDFDQWFNKADSATLEKIGGVHVTYVNNAEDALAKIKSADVLYLSHNWPMTNSALQKAITEFADSGKGILLVHPALWYNWKNWPEYNQAFVGGGARSHDRYGQFEVTVTEPNHPVMKGIPQKFQIKDELYHSEKDPKGTSIEVLATAFETSSGKTFPSVWIPKHPKARIVCIAPGHDGMAHNLPEYQTLLQNSWKWVAKRQ